MRSSTDRFLVQGGDALSLVQMTTPQRQRFLAALEPSGEDRVPFWQKRTPDPDEWPALQFRLERREVQEQEFREDRPGRAAFQYPLRLDPTRPLNLPARTTPVGEPSTLDEIEFVYALANHPEPLRRTPFTLRLPTVK